MRQCFWPNRIVSDITLFLKVKMEQSTTPREPAKDQKPDLKLVSAPGLAKTPLQPPQPRKSLRQRMGAWAKWIVVGLALAAAVFYFGQSYFFGPIIVVDRIKQQDVVQTVVASGRVETPFRINIGTQVTGVVKDIPVAEGQTVKTGDVLIQLDETDIHESVKLAQSVVAQWQAKLDQLTNVSARSAEETKAQAQAVVIDSQVSYDRALKLYRQGYASKAALDSARRALDIALSQVRAADLQVATNRPGGMDYMTAQTQLDQANASLNSAEAKLGYYQIKAPRDGILISRNVERGNVVQPSAILMVLAPAGETQIVVQIDESNLGLLKIGQKATISADAYPKKNFEGLLSYINPSINAQTGSVEVKLSVPRPPDYLRQDMTVSVEIEVAHIANAIAVDASSIRDMSSNKPSVMVVENGRANLKTVTIGIIGDAAVEVTSGLKSGDVIVRGTNVGLTVGQRVRVQSNE
jgi:HlyD family secretion protein